MGEASDVAHGGHDGEGVSLVPAFQNKPLDRAAPLFFEHEGNAAVIDGDWKLVRFGGKGGWELYNLKSDRTEQNNLATAHPDRVKTLKSSWKGWAARCNVSPNGLPGRKK